VAPGSSKIPRGPQKTITRPKARDEDEEGYEDEDEARRGRIIPPRFDPQYPVAFPAESVAHFRTFGSGNVSSGREVEATGLL
jgi:hypothetical protein